VDAARALRTRQALRVAFAWSVLALAVVLVVGAGLELAASGKINKGVTIDGVLVGGMTRARARELVERKVKPLKSDVLLSCEGKRHTINLEGVNFRLDIDGMVREAFYKGKRGPALLRIARRLLGAGVTGDVPVMCDCDRTRLEARLATIARAIDRDSRSVSISVASGSPKIISSRSGIKVRIDDTVRAVRKALPTENRLVDIVADTIKPKIVEADVGKIVVIHQKQFALYLYDHEEEINSFKIAVGMQEYPTPNGRFHITFKEKNPTWLPTSEWAKDKKGIPQPPGPDNPLGGYWMDLGGGIGIHATPFPKSLGDQASHGCIRMAPSDAAALFNAVKVGTPVFIID